MPPNFNAQYWCLMFSKNGNDNGNSRSLGTPLCPFLHVCKPTSWRAGDPLRWWNFICFQFIDTKKTFSSNPPKRPSLKHSWLMVFIHRWHSPSMDCPWYPLRWHRCNPRLVNIILENDHCNHDPNPQVGVMFDPSVWRPNDWQPTESFQGDRTSRNG